MPKRELLAFVNGNVVLPDRVMSDGVVLCAGGRVQCVAPRKGAAIPKHATLIDAGGGYISPGFVDLHVHGGDGADYMDGDAEAVRAVNRCHARHGTTTIFPTTTTGTPAQILAMLDACAAVRNAWTPADGARLEGVHFYGPYFAESKVGCHLKSGRRDPVRAEYLRAFDTGVVRIATCAAELPGAAAFYREAKRRGYLVTCGHSEASWTEMRRAFDQGMSHVDHFWCAMSSIPSVAARLGTPMQGSMAEFVLMKKAMSTEVLADGEHLSPELLEFAWRMIGAGRLCLVTDSSRALDMPPGDYRFGPRRNGSWFRSNGKVGFIPSKQIRKTLASSVAGLDRMVRTMKASTSAGLAEVIRMASLTPAERAGIAKDVGSLERGKRADVLVLSSKLQVRRVFMSGEEYRGAAPAKRR